MDKGQSTRDIGKKYEELAVSYLLDKGYRILDRNFRIGRNSEIDIVAKDNNTIVFVEVKYRSGTSSGHPFESVNVSKQRKICNAARGYIYCNGLSPDIPYRFDVIGICREKVEHVENAFMYMGR